MLKIENITIKFGGLVANNNVCTEIKEGQIFGLIGPNGAGKTTLFNIVSGFYAPTSGKVIFNGEEIQGKPSNEIAYKGIMRTYQNINLFKKMTTLENVMVGCHSLTNATLWDAIIKSKKSQKEHEEALEKCHEVMKFMNIDQFANVKAANLPYGDQRRLEIARALVSNPKLILLDEPAAGMNLSEKDVLAETIQKIRDRGHTVFLVEHHMKLVTAVCDRICVLNHGNKIAEGTPEEIQNHPEVIAAYLGGAQK
ncbi:MAG: ABC transporter ATP-binding protein [Ruminococcaceae bacterium]|nr:ABC transporter ATP-binding protein [Oscillospiraceae bacterium]